MHRLTNGRAAGLHENAMEQAGYAPLALGDLLGRISDHTFWGDFQSAYTYASWCGGTGLIEGTNNVGSYNTGRWHADHARGLFMITFDQSWVPAALVAYEVDGLLQFFNRATGLWHMNIRHILPGRRIADFTDTKTAMTIPPAA